MAFTLIRKDGDGEWGELLASAAAHLPCPRNESWAVSVDARSPIRALVAIGPRRLECGPEWAVAPAGQPDRWHHRREPGALAQLTSEIVEEMLRDLVWHPVQTAPNPIRRTDPALGRALEAAVLAELEFERDDPLVVRFNSWTGADDGPRYVCKVECAPRAGIDAAPAWRWWSPLVRDPEELATHLRRALRARARSRAPAAPAREFWGWGAVGQAGA